MKSDASTLSNLAVYMVLKQKSYGPHVLVRYVIQERYSQSRQQESKIENPKKPKDNDDESLPHR